MDQEGVKGDQLLPSDVGQPGDGGLPPVAISNVDPAAATIEAFTSIPTRP